MSYATNLLALNAICIASGGTGGHPSMLPALNELCTLQGVETGHLSSLPALNAIDAGLGGTGEHHNTLTVLNSICELISGAGGHTSNLSAWNEIASIGLAGGLLTLTRNSDLVPVTATSGVSTGAGVLTATADPGDHVLIKYKTDRIRQTGNIAKIDLPTIVDPVNAASFKFFIWRKDGTTYDKIATLDLLPLVSTGLNSLTLASPIAVQEGDFMGYHLQRAGGSNVAFLAATTLADSIYYTTAETPTDTNYAWESKTAGGAVPRTLAYMQAPLLVGIGDSIMEGYPAHSSFVDSGFAQVDMVGTWFYQLRTLDARCVYQNLGVGGNTTTQILARFDSQASASKARICVINGGVNDIAGGTITKAVFLANWRKILDKCTLANMYPVVWSIMPWTDGTTEQNQARDDWNNDLATLVAEYTHAKFIDWDSILGQFRVGGDVGNLWDIKTEYDEDGVHFNDAGNAAIAAQMLTTLTSAFTEISTTYTTAYQAVYNAFTTKPGIGEAWFQNEIVRLLVAGGVWAKHDAIQNYAAHTNTGGESQKDWISLSRVINPVDSPTFTAHSGMVGNGTSSYVDTGWKPSDGVNFTQDSATFWIYCRTARAASNPRGHGVLGASNYVALQQRTGGGNFTCFLNTTTAASVANSNSSGLFLARRDNSSQVDLWRNGTEVDADNAANSSGRPTKNVFMGCYNSDGTATYFTVDEIAWWGAASALTDGEITTLTNAIERYMDAFDTGVI